MKRDNTLFPECLSKILDEKNVGVPTCIETIIKNEVAKKWYQRQNMIVFTKHMEKTDLTCFDEHRNNHRVIWNSSMFISV